MREGRARRHPPPSREGRWWLRRARTGHRAFVLYLAVVVAGLVVSIGGRAAETRLVPLLVIACATPVLTALAVHWYRPAHGWVWLVVAAAESFWAVAMAIDPASDRYAPNAALTIHEALSTVAYGAIWVALVTLGRLTRPTRRSLSGIDSSIVLVAVFAVLWGVNRWAYEAGHQQLSAFASLVFPLADGAIALALVRLSARTAVARPSYLLALGGVVALLVGDVCAVVESSPTSGRVTPLLFYAVYALLGLAALHPSMAAITESREAWGAAWATENGRVHIAVLWVSMLAPGTVLLLIGPSADVLTGLGVAVACTGSVALVLVRLAGMVRLVEQQSTRLSGIARSDPLTNLPNRRTVDAEVERALAEAALHDEPLVVGLLDLDHFKAFNDQRGHGAGDRLLTSVSTTWRRSLPPEVFVGRYGGEEFLLVVRGRELDEVSMLVDALRPEMPPGATFSAGLACWDGVEPSVVLVGRADRALYAAKGGGRASTWEVRVPGTPPRASSTSAARVVSPSVPPAYAQT